MKQTFPDIEHFLFIMKKIEFQVAIFERISILKKKAIRQFVTVPGDVQFIIMAEMASCLKMKPPLFIAIAMHQVSFIIMNYRAVKHKSLNMSLEFIDI